MRKPRIWLSSRGDEFAGPFNSEAQRLDTTLLPNNEQSKRSSLFTSTRSLLRRALKGILPVHQSNSCMVKRTLLDLQPVTLGNLNVGESFFESLSRTGSFYFAETEMSCLAEVNAGRQNTQSFESQSIPNVMSRRLRTNSIKFFGHNPRHTDTSVLRRHESRFGSSSAAAAKRSLTLHPIADITETLTPTSAKLAPMASDSDHTYITDTELRHSGVQIEDQTPQFSVTPNNSSRRSGSSGEVAQAKRSRFASFFASLDTSSPVVASDITVQPEPVASTNAHVNYQPQMQYPFITKRGVPLKNPTSDGHPVLFPDDHGSVLQKQNSEIQSVDYGATLAQRRQSSYRASRTENVDFDFWKQGSTTSSVEALTKEAHRMEREALGQLNDRDTNSPDKQLRGSRLAQSVARESSMMRTQDSATLNSRSLPQHVLGISKDPSWTSSPDGKHPITVVEPLKPPQPHRPLTRTPISHSTASWETEEPDSSANDHKLCESSIAVSPIPFDPHKRSLASTPVLEDSDDTTEEQLDWTVKYSPSRIKSWETQSIIREHEVSETIKNKTLLEGFERFGCVVPFVGLSADGEYKDLLLAEARKNPFATQQRSPKLETKEEERAFVEYQRDLTLAKLEGRLPSPAGIHSPTYAANGLLRHKHFPSHVHDDAPSKEIVTPQPRRTRFPAEEAIHHWEREIDPHFTVEGQNERFLGMDGHNYLQYCRMLEEVDQLEARLASLNDLNTNSTIGLASPPSSPRLRYSFETMTSGYSDLRPLDEQIRDVGEDPDHFCLETDDEMFSGPRNTDSEDQETVSIGPVWMPTYFDPL